MFVFTELLDLLKGPIYLFYQPHVVWATFLLSCTLIFPFSCCLITVKCRHVMHDDEEEELEETYNDILSAYFAIGDYDVVLKEEFRRITKISENLPEMIIFFYENFQRGNRMTPMILLFPVISFVGYT